MDIEKNVKEFLQGVRDCLDINNWDWELCGLQFAFIALVAIMSTFLAFVFIKIIPVLFSI